MSSVAPSCLTLCDPMACMYLTMFLCPCNYSGKNTGDAISKWVAISSSRGSSQSRDQYWIWSWIPCIGRWILYYCEVKVKSLSRVRLCDPGGCSQPGSSIHGILQARILEWVAISFSRGSSQPRGRTRVSHIPGRRFNLWAPRLAPPKSPHLIFTLISSDLCPRTMLCGTLGALVFWECFLSSSPDCKPPQSEN